MTIAPGSIVSFEYQVRTADKVIVEQTSADEPVQYMHGSGMLLPALEAIIGKMSEGEDGNFVIPASMAYGARDETNVVLLPRTIFSKEVSLVVGNRLTAKTNTGDTYPLTVLRVLPTQVEVDLNHPLAGKDLHFNLTVRSVRSAGTEELFTGKPHPVIRV